MWKMMGKVPRERDRPTAFSAPGSTGQTVEPGAGGLAAAQPGSAGREVMVSRLGRISPWLLALVAALPLAAARPAPAGAQNLDAGKSASQIFSEVCANCHRSPRELKSNASASFLREHYTTGSEMASTMAAYLAGGAGGGDQRAPGGAQPKRPPNPTGSPVAGTPPAAATGRDAQAPDTANPKRAQQTADPKASPTSPASPGSPKGRPARAEGTAEAKPLGSAPPAPARPALEEFEE
jgi:hypothetical protein